MKKTIKVTQEDIDKGFRLQNDYCPVALAMCRGINKDIGQVKVGRRGMSFHDHSGMLVCMFEMPDLVKIFVENFDKGYKVTPFEFELDT